MAAIRCVSVLVLAVLLAAATASADTVITAQEVITCSVVWSDTNFTRLKLPNGSVRMLYTRDIREVRLSDSSRVAELASQLPQVKVVPDSARCASPPDTVAQSASPIRPANRFISAELLSFGACHSTAEEGGGDANGTLPSVRLLHVGYEYDRVRLGLALVDLVGCPVFRVLPLTAGFTIYEQPIRYAGSLYAKVPEVYVEAMGSFINGDPIGSSWQHAIPFIGTLELVGSVDGYGVGGSLAVGLCRVATTTYWIEPLSLYAVIRLHLLRFRFGF